MNADQSSGIYADADWFAAWQASPPPEAHLRINGRTPLSRVEALHTRWITQLRDQQLAAFELLRQRTEAEVIDANETLNLIPEKVDEWLKAMRSGSLDPEQVKANIAEVTPALRAIRDVYETARLDASAALAMVDEDPEEYARRRSERFPSLRRTDPYITEAWLRGEPGATDPLGSDA